MTRTLKAIKATFYNRKEEKELVIFVKDFEEKTLEKVFTKLGAKLNMTIDRDTISKQTVNTKMSLETWGENCEIVSSKPYDENATDSDTDTDTDSD